MSELNWSRGFAVKCAATLRIGKARTAILGSLLASVVSFSAQAADFSAADAAFELRADPAELTQAFALYSAIAPTVSGADLIYTVEQLSKLAYLKGNVAPESDSAARKVAFKSCTDAADLISPANFGSETFQYHYWKGLCLAAWAKANGVLKSLEKAGEILGHIEDGKKLDDTYEGGGFYRVGSAVYLNLPPLFGGDIDKALDYSRKAIASPAYSGSPNPDTDTGNYFYLAYLYAGQIAAKKEGKEAAKAIIKSALDRIAEGDIPTSRQPETEVNRAELQAFYDSL